MPKEENIIETFGELLGNLRQCEVNSDINIKREAIPNETSLRTCIYEHIYGLLQQPTLSKEQIEFIQAMGHLANTLVGDEGQ